jgi:hypothetical protein
MARRVKTKHDLRDPSEASSVTAPLLMGHS